MVAGFVGSHFSDFLEGSKPIGTMFDGCRAAPPTIVVRGYDSGDLFRKDALIRIRVLDRELAEYIKPLR